MFLDGADLGGFFRREDLQYIVFFYDSLGHTPQNDNPDSFYIKMVINGNRTIATRDPGLMMTGELDRETKDLFTQPDDIFGQYLGTVL